MRDLVYMSMTSVQFAGHNGIMVIGTVCPYITGKKMLDLMLGFFRLTKSKYIVYPCRKLSNGA